jgi:hypothetical protein
MFWKLDLFLSSSELLRVAFSNGPNRVGVSPLPEDGNRSSFPVVVSSFRIPNGGQSPKTK